MRAGWRTSWPTPWRWWTAGPTPCPPTAASRRAGRCRPRSKALQYRADVWYVCEPNGMTNSLRMLQRVLLLLLALAGPLLLLSLNVRLLASESFLRLEYGRTGFPVAPGFTAEERLALAVPSTVFVVPPMPPDDLAALEHAGAPLYTASEITHLVDVRRLVRRLTALAVLGLALLVLGAAAWWVGRLPGYARACERGGWLTVGLVVAIGLGIGGAG